MSDLFTDEERLVRVLGDYAVVAYVSGAFELFFSRQLPTFTELDETVTALSIMVCDMISTFPDEVCARLSAMYFSLMLSPSIRFNTSGGRFKLLSKL
jgi:hypothetical protein